MKSYSNNPVTVAAEADVIRRGTHKVPAVLLVQCAAPKDLLLGTDLLEALGICLNLSRERLTEEEARQPTPITVKLIEATKILARHARIVRGIVSQRVERARACLCPSLLCVESMEAPVVWDPALLSVSDDLEVVLVTKNTGVTLPAGESAGSQH